MKVYGSTIERNVGDDPVESPSLSSSSSERRASFLARSLISDSSTEEMPAVPSEHIAELSVCDPVLMEKKRMMDDVARFSNNGDFVKTWDILFSKKEILSSWECDDDGNFNLQLKDYLKLYMEDFPLNGSNNDLYQICICVGNEAKGISSVNGKFHREENKVTFEKGLDVRVKQGLFPIPTIKYQYENCISIEGSLSLGITSLSRELHFQSEALHDSWIKGEIVEGCEKKFLRKKFLDYAAAKKIHYSKNPRFFLRDI